MVPLQQDLRILALQFIVKGLARYPPQLAAAQVKQAAVFGELRPP